MSNGKDDFFSTLNLVDGELVLRFTGKANATPPDTDITVYRFAMHHAGSGDEIGQINIKAGYTENITYFRGNIGYSVNEKFRGHRYAGRSCMLLAPVIRFLELNPVYITCDVDNIASRKNIEMTGAEFLGTVTVKETSPYFCYYAEGSRMKLRYKWEIGEPD